MRAQVLGEVVDPLRQQRDLDLGRARVGLARPVMPDNLQLCFPRKGHLTSMSSVPATRRKQARSRGCGLRQGSNDLREQELVDPRAPRSGGLEALTSGYLAMAGAVKTEPVQ